MSIIILQMALHNRKAYSVIFLSQHLVQLLRLELFTAIRYQERLKTLENLVIGIRHSIPSDIYLYDIDMLNVQAICVSLAHPTGTILYVPWKP